MLVAGAVSLLLSLPLFEPFSWWPMGFVVLAPLAVAVVRCARGRTAWLGVYLFGVVFFLVHWRWLYTTTGAGYVAGAIYQAMFWIPVAWALRHMHRRWRCPMTVALPIAWVAGEMLRSLGPLAFPWFLLGHSQIRCLPMIQIADFGGVYAVSLVLAAANGWLADLALRRWWRASPTAPGWPRPVWTALTVTMVLGTLIYGRYRLGYAGFVPGPKVAVVQGDYQLFATRGAMGATDSQKERGYLDLLAEAGKAGADLILMPETPWSLLLNAEAEKAYTGVAEYRHMFKLMARLYQSAILVGAMSSEPQPTGSYPEEHRYNSAFLFSPDTDTTPRYDKMHLVPFGEYVPFRYTRGLFWLYRFLNDSWFNPWGRGGNEYSLTPGEAHTTFTVHPRQQTEPTWDFGVVICYEDVIPQVFRRFVADPAGNKRVDFMANISNDGWFGRGTQQPQHLVQSAFRAVENRVPVARSVNTGVSGFVRSDGSWHDLVSPSDDRPRAGGSGYRVATLRIDPRVTFYSRYGNVLGWACVLAAGLAWLDAGAGRGPLRRVSRLIRRPATLDT